MNPKTLPKSIVLLTDFGNADGYAGVLKGVIASIHPQAQVIDLSHEVRPFCITQAGLILNQAYRYFPRRTIFVCVVDPEVGSERRPVLVNTRDYSFIGPDNGLLTLALEKEEIRRIVHLDPEKILGLLKNHGKAGSLLKDFSSTFHGRDLFAPAAALLSRGISEHKLGLAATGYQKSQDFYPDLKGGKIRGKILSIDRFGNGVTNLTQKFLSLYHPGLRFFLKLKNRALRERRSYYSQGRGKKPFLIFGSTNFLEISIDQGSAEKILKLRIGDVVQIEGSS